ncbi:MAG: tetratricopeptide repeat protein [Nitrospirae bacterium]|nr:tetratricopeptide repeat protein [Nitrospirota bacterium]
MVSRVAIASGLLLSALSLLGPEPGTAAPTLDGLFVTRPLILEGYEILPVFHRVRPGRFVLPESQSVRDLPILDEARRLVQDGSFSLAADRVDVFAQSGGLRGPVLRAALFIRGTAYAGLGAGDRKAFNAALSDLREVINRLPPDELTPAALEQVGGIYAALEFDVEAIGALDRVSAEFPQSPSAGRSKLLKAFLLLRQGRPDQAHAVFESAHKTARDPGVVAAGLFGMAECLMAGGRFGEARRVYAKLLADWPGEARRFPVLLFRAAEAAFVSRAFGEGRNLYLLLINIHPRDPLALLGMVRLGDLETELGKDARAERLYRDVLKLDPDGYAGKLARLGLATVHGRNAPKEPLSAEALKERFFVKDLTKEKPSRVTVEAELKLAAEREAAGDFKEAARTYDALLLQEEIGGSHAAARKGLERLVPRWISFLRGRGDAAEAVRVIDERIGPPSKTGTATALIVSRAYREAGRVENAHAWTKALAGRSELTRDERAEVSLALVESALALGKTDEGARIFRGAGRPLPATEATAKALKRTGDAFFLAGRRTEAGEAFRDAAAVYSLVVKNDSSARADPVRLAQTALFFDSVGETEKAGRLMAEAISKTAGRNDLAGWGAEQTVTLGDLWAKAGKCEMAREAYEAAKKTPLPLETVRRTQFDIARCYERTGERARAMKIWDGLALPAGAGPTDLWGRLAQSRRSEAALIDRARELGFGEKAGSGPGEGR